MFTHGRTSKDNIYEQKSPNRDPFDGIVLRFVNPLTGGPTLRTLSCEIQMLRPGEQTKSHRHTSSTIYHVFKGNGFTVVGDDVMTGRKATRSPYRFGSGTITATFTQ